MSPRDRHRWPPPHVDRVTNWSFVPARSTTITNMHGRHASEQWLKRLLSIGRRRHRHDLELDEIAPERDPTLQEARVVTFHQLEAALEIGLDPAIDVAQPVGRAAPFLAQAAIDRLG